MKKATLATGLPQPLPRQSSVWQIALDRVRRSKRIGPQLPRPQRIRVPTRRELASYGIKLPSQRAAEEKAREAQRNQYDSGDHYNDDEIDAMQQDELARQFAQTQQQRYGEQYQHDVPANAEDADAAAEAELARQFAQTQQQRYSGEQPAGANPFTLDDFEFSPMKALLDDGPHEPLFTPIVEPVQQPQQPIAPQQQYQQPQQPVAPQPQYQQPQQPVAPQQQYQQPQQPVAPQQQYQQPQQPVAQQPQYQQPQQPVAPQPHDTLLHPLLMRNGDSRPLHKPTTPLPSLDLLTPPPSEVEPVDTLRLNKWRVWWKRVWLISVLKPMSSITLRGRLSLALNLTRHRA